MKKLVLKKLFEEYEDRDFLFSLIGSLFFYSCLLLLIHGIQVQVKPREDFKRVAPQIAKLIVEAPKPVPLPKTQGPEQKTLALPKGPDPQPKPAEGPKKKEEPAVKAPDPAPPPPPSPEEIRLRLEQEAKIQRQRNREVAMQSGLLRLLTKEDKGRAAAKDVVDDQNLQKVLSPVSGLNKLQSSPDPNKTASVGTGASASGSGGIDHVIALLKEQGNGKWDGAGGEGPGGGMGLGERQTARVVSPFEIRGEGGGEATRSYESIHEVVSSLTGWIRFVYNRALRENPSLKGVITLEFQILPSGEVSHCRVLSSTVGDPALEEVLSKRFSQLKFDPIKGEINTVIYPITLVPLG